MPHTYLYLICFVLGGGEGEGGVDVYMSIHPARSPGPRVNCDYLGEVDRGWLIQLDLNSTLSLPVALLLRLLRLLFLRDPLVLHVQQHTGHVRRPITGTHGRFPCTYHCEYVLLEVRLRAGLMVTQLPLARVIPRYSAVVCSLVTARQGEECASGRDSGIELGFNLPNIYTSPQKPERAPGKPL
jgi:hypothetical protein